MNTLPHINRYKGIPSGMARIEFPSLSRAREIADQTQTSVTDVVSAAVDHYHDVHNARVFLRATPEGEILSVPQARRAARKGGSK